MAKFFKCSLLLSVLLFPINSLALEKACINDFHDILNKTLMLIQQYILVQINVAHSISEIYSHN